MIESNQIHLLTVLNILSQGTDLAAVGSSFSHEMDHLGLFVNGLGKYSCYR